MYDGLPVEGTGSDLLVIHWLELEGVWEVFETQLRYGGRTDLGFMFVFANVSVEQESPPTFYFILRKG